MSQTNTHPKTNKTSLLKKAKHLSIIIAAVLSLLIVNTIWNTAVSWLVGVNLGLNVFDKTLTDTERAQIIIATLFIDALTLLLIRRFWLSQRRTNFWRYVRTTALVLSIISLISGVILPSVLFIRGQRGEDYGCSQTIDLNRAYNATYPINTESGGGTAFAIDSNGTLLTAYHVIAGAKDITLGDGSNTKLSIIRVNKAFDVALLHYDKPTPDYIPLTTNYSITDPVYEIGWPDNVDYNGSGTITEGIISRFISTHDARDSDDNVPNHMSYIQTDAATNSGNSGGPLLDYCGAVGVVNSSSVTMENGSTTPQYGINYATSTEAIKYALKLK
jgi:S1-C subfamily serine protease